LSFQLENCTNTSLNRPVEIHQIQLKPTDFFTANPSIDVPSSKNLASQLVKNGKCCDGKDLTVLNGANGVNGRGVTGTNGSTNGVIH
jgi:primary-amine oxidase